MKPSTYREQPACANCKHRNWHSAYEWLCVQDGTVEPDDEMPLGWSHDLTPWGMWRRGREVAPHGICDRYEPKSEAGGEQ